MIDFHTSVIPFRNVRMKPTYLREGLKKIMENSIIGGGQQGPFSIFNFFAPNGLKIIGKP